MYLSVFFSLGIPQSYLSRDLKGVCTVYVYVGDHFWVFPYTRPAWLRKWLFFAVSLWIALFYWFDISGRNSNNIINERRPFRDTFASAILKKGRNVSLFLILNMFLRIISKHFIIYLILVLIIIKFGIIHFSRISINYYIILGRSLTISKCKLLCRSPATILL